jgi:hypothetical protein
MTARQAFSAAVVAALIGGLSLPAAAQQPAGSTGRPLDIHASLQRAVARAAAQESSRPAGTAIGKVKAAKQNSNGSSSGGGHTTMIVTLVGVAAGIGGTIYAVHQMQKTEDTLTATPH